MRRVVALVAPLLVVAVALWVMWQHESLPPGALPPQGTADALAAVACAEDPVACPPTAPDTSCRACHGQSAGLSSTLHGRHDGAASCTDCHRGSGAYRSQARAHGRHPRGVAEPLLAGPWVQASCVACHVPWGPPSGADHWQRGDILWQSWGCAGCHESEENRLAPDLTSLAGWWAQGRIAPHVPLPFADGPPLAGFIAEALVDPSSHLDPDLPAASRPSVMPPFSGSADDLRDLTIRVMSMRDWRLPTDSGAPSPPPTRPAPGARLFADSERGCSACHAVDGAGGALGPPLDHWRGGDAADLRRDAFGPNRTPTPGYPPLHPDDLTDLLSVTEQTELVDWLIRP